MAATLRRFGTSWTTFPVNRVLGAPDAETENGLRVASVGLAAPLGNVDHTAVGRIGQA